MNVKGLSGEGEAIQFSDVASPVIVVGTVAFNRRIVITALKLCLIYSRSTAWFSTYVP